MAEGEAAALRCRGGCGGGRGCTRTNLVDYLFTFANGGAIAGRITVGGPIPPRSTDRAPILYRRVVTKRFANSGERRYVRRATARILLIDDRDRLLLFADSDPGSDARWWITPGGGIDAGETPREAALRELVEETGLHLPAERLIGPVATRIGVHHYSNRSVENADTYFAARVPAFEVDESGHTEDEKVTMLGHRWWSRDDLAATTEWIVPAALVEVWDRLADPDGGPIDLGRDDLDMGMGSASA